MVTPASHTYDLTLRKLVKLEHSSFKEVGIVKRESYTPVLVFLFSSLVFIPHTLFFLEEDFFFFF